MYIYIYVRSDLFPLEPGAVEKNTAGLTANPMGGFFAGHRQASLIVQSTLYVLGD